jgi:chromosome segregation ATPase
MPAEAGPTLEARVAALERECDELRATLDQERARRRKLEAVYAAARDRIARALDSLHTILNGKS